MDACASLLPTYCLRGVDVNVLLLLLLLLLPGPTQPRVPGLAAHRHCRTPQGERHLCGTQRHGTCATLQLPASCSTALTPLTPAAAAAHVASMCLKPQQWCQNLRQQQQQSLHSSAWTGNESVPCCFPRSVSHCGPASAPADVCVVLGCVAAGDWQCHSGSAHIHLVWSHLER
jgi:hypothetical protein